MSKKNVKWDLQIHVTVQH